MKLTKQEFCEYVRLYEVQTSRVRELDKQFNSNFLDSLMFPCFEWIEEKLGLKESDIILDYIYFHDREQAPEWYKSPETLYEHLFE